MTLPRNVRGGRWPAISQSGHGSYEYISAPNHPLNFNRRILLYNTRTLSRLLMSKSRHKYHRTSTLKSFRLEHRHDSACILSAPTKVVGLISFSRQTCLLESLGRTQIWSFIARKFVLQGHDGSKLQRDLGCESVSSGFKRVFLHCMNIARA